MPIVIDLKGHIPVASGVSKHKIDCSATSISPSSNLNILGGDILTISGSGFPSGLDSLLSINFDDT